MTGAANPAGPNNFIDRALVQSAQLLEEAWAWGYDVDAWRAHLSVATWPEVGGDWGHGMSWA